jgi:two-component system, OmpR family, response regulator
MHAPETAATPPKTLLLLVEDDPQLGEAVRDGLRQDGYAVDWARDGAMARTLLDAEHAYQAVLLDLSLPHESGLSILKGLRLRQDPTPVLVITARDAVAERIEGLDLGADDYLVKPFDLDELAARLRAVMRRRQGAVVAELRHGRVRMDVPRRAVYLEDTPVSVSAQEFRTLMALMQRSGRVVPRRELEEAVYGWNAGIESNAIEVYVHQLRRKLGSDVIETVRGFGYRVG